MAITCKAAITDGSGNFKIEDIQVDEPQAGEVLVKMKAAGICRTDYNSLKWGRQLIIGHEGAGIVEKTGKHVTGLQPGDSVILTWARHNDPCLPCLEGNAHLCEMDLQSIENGDGLAPDHACLSGTTQMGVPVLRSFNIGTLAEYTLVNASAVVKNNSPRMSFSAACIINCGVMTGFGLVFNAAKVREGSDVVVVGVGSVGINVIQGARIAGAAKIIAVDTNVIRLSMAKKFGATHIVFVDKTCQGLLQAAERVNELTNNFGADYVFECIATAGFEAAAKSMTCQSGMAVQVNGVEHELTSNLPVDGWDKTKSAVYPRNCRSKIDFKKIMSHYEEGAYQLEEMVTRTYPLSDLGRAFCDMLSSKNAKGVIVFE